jgi:hypothetical protein
MGYVIVFEIYDVRYREVDSRLLIRRKLLHLAVIPAGHKPKSRGFYERLDAGSMSGMTNKEMCHSGRS